MGTIALMDGDRVERYRNASAWLFATILLAAVYLRFTGLNWDEGQWIHPDEGHMRIITGVIRVPDSPALYFDTHHSPLNCRNSGYVYSYGTLPLFLTRWTAEWLDRRCQLPAGGVSAVLNRLPDPAWGAACTFGAFTGSASALIGRFFSALFDLGTVVLVYLIGRRLYGRAAGWLAMVFAAFTPFTIQQAHFFTVDSAATFFMVLTVYFSVRAGQTDVSRRPSWLDFGLAGIATGLAAACKVSAVLAALFVTLAGLWWWLRAVRTLSPRPALRSLLLVLPPLLLAAVLSLVAFRVAQPYAFEGPGFFGVKPSPEWLERLGQIQAEQNGEMDLPSGRQRRASLGLSVVVVGCTLLWALTVFSIYTRPNTRLAASRWIYDHVPAGSVVANEHWDWGLPLPVDGHNPFAGMYTGLEMQNYNEDTPEKLEHTLAWLDRADYIFLASNRLYASIPRLPARYPMTINYYRRLFSGELGFDLVADFTSRPALGPFQFPDQECPFPLMKAAYVHQTQPVVVTLPPAEEAFSVYDHPRVLIFEKTARFDLAQARALLTEGVNWSQVAHGLRPQDVTR